MHIHTYIDTCRYSDGQTYTCMYTYIHMYTYIYTYMHYIYIHYIYVLPGAHLGKQACAMKNINGERPLNASRNKIERNLSIPKRDLLFCKKDLQTDFRVGF